jgi:hypothetical protein
MTNRAYRSSGLLEKEDIMLSNRTRASLWLTLLGAGRTDLGEKEQELHEIHAAAANYFK